MRHILVPFGVIAGVLLALWFSTVVALGPALNKTSAQNKTESARSAQARPEQRQADKAKDEALAEEDKAYCKNGANEYDCLIQLRTARATEAQARWAEFNAYLVGATILLTLGTVVAGFLTLKTMRETAQKQLRAYVSGRPIHISSLDATNCAWARFSIINSGATPANDVEHWAVVDVFEYRCPLDFSSPHASLVAANSLAFRAFHLRGA